MTTYLKNSLLGEQLLHLPQHILVPPYSKFEIIDLDFLPAGDVGDLACFVAGFNYEVCCELVEDADCFVEGVLDVAEGVEIGSYYGWRGKQLGCRL